MRKGSKGRSSVVKLLDTGQRKPIVWDFLRATTIYILVPKPRLAGTELLELRRFFAWPMFLQLSKLFKFAFDLDPEVRIRGVVTEGPDGDAGEIILVDEVVLKR